MNQQIPKKTSIRIETYSVPVIIMGNENGHVVGFGKKIVRINTRAQT